MPSKTVHRLLGEADVPKPGSLFQQAYPATGQQSNLKWRVHRVVGVAPTNIDEGDYDEWLYQLMEANVDSEFPCNEVATADLPKLITSNKYSGEQYLAFLREAEQVARHTGADRVAFTTLDGLD